MPAWRWSCRTSRDSHGVTHIGLAGVVFQNRILTEQAAERLKADGFGVHIPADVPVNDAGLSAGQVIEYGYGQLPGIRRRSVYPKGTRARRA